MSCCISYVRVGIDWICFGLLFDDLRVSWWVFIKIGNFGFWLDEWLWVSNEKFWFKIWISIGDVSLRIVWFCWVEKVIWIGFD